MTGIVTWLVSGVVAGVLVRAGTRGPREFGLLGDVTLGCLGAVLGGWLFRRLGITAPDTGPAHIVVALGGAAMLIALLRLLRHAVMRAPVTLVPTGLDTDVHHRAHLLSDLERAVLDRLLKHEPRPHDPNQTFDAQLTFGQRVADRVATFGGSWTFIGLFMLGLVAWMLVQTDSARAFDPYPFILLNLVLSCVAALQAPVIMMSQNRLAAKDRLDARNDYEVNMRAEMEILGLHAKLDAVREREWREFLDLQREQLEILRRIEGRGTAAESEPQS